MDYVDYEESGMLRAGMWMMLLIAVAAFLLCYGWYSAPMLVPLDTAIDSLAASGWCKWIVTGGAVLLSATLIGRRITAWRKP